MSFSFRGEIPASKSVLIRTLLLRSFDSGLKILGDSGCDDVRVMKAAIADLNRGAREIDCGEAGLVLRLMLARVSRLSGEFLLKGSSRLLARPHTPLLDVLSRLGARTQLGPDGIRVHSTGWREPGEPVFLDRTVSSQFASAVLLSAWGLDFPLRLQWKGDAVSSGYFEISLEMAREMGMDIRSMPEGVEIPSAQRISSNSYRAELDYSSAFSVGALAAVAGEAEILNPAPQSRQPDSAFVGLLGKMGVSVEQGSVLKIKKAAFLKPLETSLSESPDLFPVLAVLCAFAEGTSVLRGAPHLKGKESDRIEKTAELLELLGRKVRRLDDGLVIEGRSAVDSGSFDFDPEQDHRLVMAAAVARAAGAGVKILHPEVVSKSFPEFLEIAGL